MFLVGVRDGADSGAVAVPSWIDSAGRFVDKAVVERAAWLLDAAASAESAARPVKEGQK